MRKARRGPSLLLAGAAAAALLSGCDFFRPFEKICEARLAPAQISVEAEQPDFATDLGQPAAALTARGAATSGRLALGLIETKLAYSAAFAANGVVKPLSGRFCMRPSVQVHLAFRPMTVFIAREHPKGSCEFELTMGHEMKHVRAYEKFLAELADTIEADLRARFGDRIHYFDGAAEGEKFLKEMTRTTLTPYIDNGMIEVEKRQRQIDSVEEYFRLDQFQARCPG